MSYALAVVVTVAGVIFGYTVTAEIRRRRDARLWDLVRPSIVSFAPPTTAEIAYTEPPPCPRCGGACHQVAVPMHPGDEAWVHGVTAASPDVSTVPLPAVAREDRYLASNELGNRPSPPPHAFLRAADLNVDTPHTGLLTFECASQANLDLVALYLRRESRSALMGFRGGRVYLAAVGAVPTPDRFPARVAIPVEIIDDPGPVEL